ncbi:hypothetical protein D3C76_801870 [compost metagenome]
MPGVVVGGFGELADQVLENQPHLMVADILRVQVDSGELLGDQIEQIPFLKLLQPTIESKVLKHLARVGGELGNVVLQIGSGAGGTDGIK